MARIFSSIAILGTLALGFVFWLGWQIGDAASRAQAVQQAVGWHFLAGVGAICFALFAHALVLTYLMGTGRWLEETCRAYRLDESWQLRSRDLKWRLYPAMFVALVALIGTSALGAASDPGSAFGFRGVLGFTGAQVHLVVAVLALLINVAVNCGEFLALQRNGSLVNEVLSEVRRIRLEKGLAV